MISLPQDVEGGTACAGPLIQVSGHVAGDFSIPRTQLTVARMTGFLFGALPCDPLQGYVMCGGERHAHYRDNGVFVWHKSSRDQMVNLWR